MLFNELNNLEDILNCSKQYEQLLSIIRDMPGAVFLVDPQHKYVALNREAEHVVGIEHVSQAIGKSVQEMPFKGAELSYEYRKFNIKTLEGKASKMLGYHYCGKGLGMLSLTIGSVTPIYNDVQQKIGIWCHGTSLAGIFLKSIHSFVKSTAKYYPKKQEQFIIDLDQTYDDLKLTPRQGEVFFFLLRGKTSKEIASLLSLSVRTVESYIENIKDRLGCFSKSELIEKGIAAGYLGILPETLLHQCAL